MNCMPRFDDDRPEWEEDPEAPDESDRSGDDDQEGSDDATCPSCGSAVYSDTDRCPHCGDYIIPAFADPSPRRRRWWIVACAIAIAAFLGSVFWFMR